MNDAAKTRGPHTAPVGSAAHSCRFSALRFRTPGSDVNQTEGASDPLVPPKIREKKSEDQVI